MEQFASLTTSFSQACDKIAQIPPTSIPQPNSTRVANTSSASARPRDRTNNIILFGLPEPSLLTTKNAIDNMTSHLIGRTVKVADAFRLGTFYLRGPTP